MRKIIVHEFITLDGVVQAPGGAGEDTEGGFVHGGWTLPYWHDDMGKHFLQAMDEADTLLLGRKTWQIHGEAFDPMPAGDPFGDVMNGIAKDEYDLHVYPLVLGSGKRLFPQGKRINLTRACPAGACFSAGSVLRSQPQTINPGDSRED